MKHLHSDRIERFLGAEQTTNISESMRKWYGPPIPISGVPGRAYACAGGEFVGNTDAGSFTNLLDRQVERTQRFMRAMARRRAGRLDAGFTSLGDLISECTTGAKRREWMFQKTGTTGVVGGTNALWLTAGQPAAGANGAAAPGGTVHVDADTGALIFSNPTGGDFQHLVSGNLFGSVAGNCLLLYDRIFSVAKTASSTATEAVTGVPTRYQSTTSGAADSAEGNFLFPEISTALGATAHNWTVCQYTDQGGTTAVSLPSVTGNSSGIANRLDMPINQFFMPLATGDTGIKALTQMQNSASVTGAVNFVMGHPLAFIPVPLANILSIYDGINGAFNLSRIFDDACLSFLEITKSATTATTYAGNLVSVAG